LLWEIPGSGCLSALPGLTRPAPARGHEKREKTSAAPGNRPNVCGDTALRFLDGGARGAQRPPLLVRPDRPLNDVPPAVPSAVEVPLRGWFDRVGMTGTMLRRRNQGPRWLKKQRKTRSVWDRGSFVGLRFGLGLR